MARDTTGRYRDRTGEAVAARRREIEVALAGLVTPELVEEHRRVPVGHHSPALAALLAYFRQAPTLGKLALHVRPTGSFSLLRLSGTQGAPHEPIAGERYETEPAALHAAFLRRLEAHGMGSGDQGRGAHDDHGGG